MTYSPPPYSGSDGQASWSSTPQSSPWPPTPVSPESPPPAQNRRPRGAIVVSAVLAAALIGATALWLVTLSRNHDLLANNEQLIEQVGAGQVERDALRSERDSLASRIDDLRTDVSDADRTLASCRQALDAAEETVDLLRDVLGLSADAIEAASTLNASRLDSINRDLDSLTPRIERAVDDYRNAATDCRDDS